MASIETSSQAMLMAEKATINLKIISTTSTAIEHSDLSDDIVALVHEVFSGHCTNELPVKAIRAITLKADMYALSFPDVFKDIAIDLLGTFTFQNEKTLFKYRIRAEEAEERVTMGRVERNTNTWLHIICGKHETASYGTIKTAAYELCKMAGVAFVEERFHERIVPGSVGQGSGKWHVQFDLTAAKFDFSGCKKKVTIGTNKADLILRWPDPQPKPTQYPHTPSPTVPCHTRAQQRVHHRLRPLRPLLGHAAPPCGPDVPSRTLAMRLPPHQGCILLFRQRRWEAHARPPGRPPTQEKQAEGQDTEPVLSSRATPARRRPDSQAADSQARGTVKRTQARAHRAPPPTGATRARPRKWKRGRLDAAVTPLTFGSPAHAWLHDLTEEGIEPHPGPKFVSKNINGIHGKGKLYLALKAIRNEVNQNPITAIFIQDHRLPQRRASELAQTAHNLQLAVVAAFAKPAHNGACYGGTMIVVPYESIEPPQGHTIHDTIDKLEMSRKATLGGRMVTASMTIQGKQRKLMAAYAPAKNEPTLRRGHFFTMLSSHVTRNTIIGIDANCVPDVRLDVHSDANSPYPNQGSQELNNMIDSKGLVDVARRTLGDEPFYTSHHIVRGGLTCKTRIDQIYLPDDPSTHWRHVPCTDFFPTTPNNVEIDHIAIATEMTQVKPTRGTDLKYIDERIYDDEDFILKLNGIMTHMYLTSTTDARTTWEEIKRVAKTMSLAATAQRKRFQSARLKLKRTQINQLRNAHTTGSATAVDSRRMQQLKDELRAETQRDTLYESLEQEAYNIGKDHDTCSAEFFRQWRPTNAAQHVTAIKEADWSDPSNPQFTGSHADTASTVLSEFTKFYKSLFARKHPDPALKRKALETLARGAQVLAPTKSKCDAPLSPPEIRKVINNLSTGKSPGPDRLPNKFYKTFSNFTTTVLTEVFNESKQHGSLPPSCKEGLISVLYKKKDRDDPRNYRPITLLNADYKILTRALTTRMNAAIKQIVSKQQNGFVPDGFIAENIMLLKLIQAHVEDQDDDGFFIFLDMEKAFDRCAWEYLLEALPKVGFGDDFIDYIRLFYSHDSPPTRRVSMSGHTGDAFPLASGVAQGCPLSPLLFLIITESFTRSVQNDAEIVGIKIGDTAHKISQYADDSTLIGSATSDAQRFQLHIHEWCGATEMAENGTKREGLLLGRLNRQRTRAPRNVIQNEAWTNNGDTIRALGVPMGNNFDEEHWWLNRYRTVKQRIAAWKSTANISLAGRNLLLQAIFYGSLRYWFFFLRVPESIIKLIKSDAHHLLWSSMPELRSNEDGSHYSRAYIHRLASYLPQKEGGGSVMHIESHIRAFKAQWIKRYLHPSETPWKTLIDIWIADKYPNGRGSILVHVSNPTFHTDIPTTAPYLRECFIAFQSLKLKQDLNKLDASVAAESIFFNPRFDIQISDDAVTNWSKYLSLKHIFNLIDQYTDEPFTSADMLNFAHQLAPSHLINTPAIYDFIDELMPTWPIIVQAIPRNIIDTIATPASTSPGAYVTFTPDHTPPYHTRVETHNGSIRYHKLWIDTHGLPHDTDTYVSDYQAIACDKVDAATWIDHDAAEDARYMYTLRSSNADDDEEEPELKTHICGPSTIIFPVNLGWHSQLTHPVPNDLIISSLSQLTIKRITALLTRQQIGSARPNCEANWQSRIGGSPIPFESLWKTLGTPLSDATEEKQWRKLLHRATNVRGRNIGASTQACRMRCGCPKESMLHIIECRVAKKLWTAVFVFTTDIFGLAPPRNFTRAIIFNQWTSDTIAPPAVCALIRHAVNCFYRDFVLIETQVSPFAWERTFARTLRSYRAAVLRYAQKIRMHHVSRQLTNKQDRVAEDSLTRFAQLVTFSRTNYSYQLTPKLLRAVSRANSAADRPNG